MAVLMVMNGKHTRVGIALWAALGLVVAGVAVDRLYFRFEREVEEQLDAWYPARNAQSFAQRTDPFLSFFGAPGVHDQPYGFMMADEDRAPGATYRVRFNNLGLRDEADFELDQARPASTSALVLVVGDSNLHGANLDQRATIPELLETSLGGEPLVRVINAAFTGSNSLANVARVEALSPHLKPDALIFGVSCNDVIPECPAVSEGRRAFYRALEPLRGRDVPYEEGRALLEGYIRAQMKNQTPFEAATCGVRPFMGCEERQALVAKAVALVPGRPVVFLHQQPHCDDKGCNLFAGIPEADQARVSVVPFLAVLRGLTRATIDADPVLTDDLRAMQRHLARPALLHEKPLYLFESDAMGHPNEVGARVVARALVDALTTLGFGPAVTATPRP
jgi:hypothetical protein